MMYCISCITEFTPKVHNQAYCSTACQEKTYNAKYNATHDMKKYRAKDVCITCNSDWTLIKIRNTSCITHFEELLNSIDMYFDDIGPLPADIENGNVSVFVANSVLSTVTEEIYAM